MHTGTKSQAVEDADFQAAGTMSQSGDQYQGKLPEKTLLNSSEKAFCIQLMDHSNLYGRQARILLSLDNGLNITELSLLLKVPEHEIETLYSRFKQARICIFPFYTVKNKSRKSYSSTGYSVQLGTRENKDLNKWTLSALLDFYGVDQGRAAQTKDNVFLIFDRLIPYHGLGKAEREIIGITALLLEIGSSVSPQEKARIGEEILLTHPLDGLELREQKLIALIMELQSSKVSEKELSAAIKGSSIWLSPGDYNRALMLASIVRFLNIPQKRGWKFLPERIKQVGRVVEIVVSGQNTRKAAKRAQKRSELWEYLFGAKLRFKPGQDLEASEIIPGKVEIREGTQKKTEIKKEKYTRRITVSPENPMSLVALRVFSQQFSRMLALEKATRKGEDIDALHDMRVAIRRMRAAAKVFEAYVDPDELQNQVSGLKKTLSALGEVRDIDVFRENMEKYAKEFPSENEHDLDSLLKILSEEKEKALKNLNNYLNSEKYSSFKHEFSNFLSAPEVWSLPTTTRKHDSLPHRVRDVLPSLLYARFADISAYSEWVEGPQVSVERLHRLRISTKGLRYTLEFFESVLGEDAKTMVEELKKFQDHLGKLHDSIIAIDLLGLYLETGEWGAVKGKTFNKKEFSENKKEIEKYLEFLEDEFQTLLHTFPEAWEKISNVESRNKIERMVKGLYEN